MTLTDEDRRWITFRRQTGFVSVHDIEGDALREALQSFTPSDWYLLSKIKEDFSYHDARCTKTREPLEHIVLTFLIEARGY